MLFISSLIHTAGPSLAHLDTHHVGLGELPAELLVNQSDHQRRRVHAQVIGLTAPGHSPEGTHACVGRCGGQCETKGRRGDR